jgi:ribosomal protein L44E
VLRVAARLTAANLQVNWPKKKNTFCKKCAAHKPHAVSQYKAGKASTRVQGTLLLPRLQPAQAGAADC